MNLIADTVSNADCKFERNEVFTERWVDSKRSENGADDERVSLLHSAWNSLLSESVDGGSAFRHGAGIDRSAVPNAPHLENCKLKEQTNERLDKRHENERLPPWTTWKGLIDTHPASMANEQIEYFRDQAISEGAYPPWITGSDEENYPVTRKVQRDIWLHQHPENCRDPNVRFLVAEWERLPGFGIGAQLVGMCGLLSIAISEKRVLVTGYYNRADHDGCKETSQECRDHAFELLGNKEALERGVITTKDNYKSKEIWNGRAPRQPTTEINGSLVAFHRKMDQRWWRAQAVRYLMRFQTQYTCGLMNIARNAAFGKEAAKMVLTSLGREWPKDFEKQRIRQRFPHLTSVWLSSEMQEVIDKSKLYTNWDFYYTNVRRQVGNTTMAAYEASLGRPTSTDYPLVNFLMAAEADFFIGALGSTWCYLIDGMRNTGGKVMAGYLSVNKDRFW
ncbi:hypothetical protein OIU76_023992 [Salix suchowensis]|nr:hypothetical protein OIU76_023992 [Salix suchowensis]